MLTEDSVNSSYSNEGFSFSLSGSVEMEPAEVSVGLSSLLSGSPVFDVLLESDETGERVLIPDMELKQADVVRYYGRVPRREKKRLKKLWGVEHWREMSGMRREHDYSYVFSKK